ncbi:MAG: hypothetical protein J7J65_02965 [Candidatus Korarchaeota archaeon]|nr:hypothetical protein [Candidatus Korarchaeota archaeon]
MRYHASPYVGRCPTYYLRAGIMLCLEGRVFRDWLYLRYFYGDLQEGAELGG